MSSYLSDIDRWRVPGDPVSRVWEERFGETRYTELAAEAWKLLLSEGGVDAGSVDHVVIAGTHDFNRGLLRRRRDAMNAMNIRIRFTGRRDWRVPRSVLREIRISEDLTRDNTGMTLTIAFNYGGRAEILDAVKQILRDHGSGTIRIERLSEGDIASRLYYPDMPDPDLVIRTSGEERISNFLLWEAAYSELWFTPVLWPDFDREILYEAIRDFQKRSRRFGGVLDDGAD